MDFYLYSPCLTLTLPLYQTVRSLNILNKRTEIKVAIEYIIGPLYPNHGIRISIVIIIPAIPTRQSNSFIEVSDKCLIISILNRKKHNPKTGKE
jgi:hypothetical protein